MVRPAGRNHTALVRGEPTVGHVRRMADVLPELSSCVRKGKWLINATRITGTFLFVNTMFWGPAIDDRHTICYQSYSIHFMYKIRSRASYILLISM